MKGHIPGRMLSLVRAQPYALIPAPSESSKWLLQHTQLGSITKSAVQLDRFYSFVAKQDLMKTNRHHEMIDRWKKTHLQYSLASLSFRHSDAIRDVCVLDQNEFELFLPIGFSFESVVRLT